jgi:hypothetical protein
MTTAELLGILTRLVAKDVPLGEIAFADREIAVEVEEITNETYYLTRYSFTSPKGDYLRTQHPLQVISYGAEENGPVTIRVRAEDVTNVATSEVLSISDTTAEFLEGVTIFDALDHVDRDAYLEAITRGIGEVDHRF